DAPPRSGCPASSARAARECRSSAERPAGSACPARRPRDRARRRSARQRCVRATRRTPRSSALTVRCGARRPWHRASNGSIRRGDVMAGSVGTKFERLVGIMRALRAPDGCPWDREQTLASLRPFVREETYEVLDAIESGDPERLREELGDFLYEAVFLAQISEEAGCFSIGDPIDAIADKLVRRHPHVFARDTPDGAPVTAQQVVEKWETLKARERATAGGQPDAPSKTTLSGVPKTLPSLLRA